MTGREAASLGSGPDGRGDAVASGVAAIGEAARLQAIASDPACSAFVSASAGSGKTKLLIDRLLRLMLPGPARAATAPERILCLTFTKAAAAEMAIRLRRVLGAFVVADDAALDRQLDALGLPATPAAREAARALFARVLDMPGGLRIGTIHAFCEQLLRRFPLEARISPHFRLLEERDSRLRLGEAREVAFGRKDLADALARVASLVDAARHVSLTEALATAAERLSEAARLAAASPDAVWPGNATLARAADVSDDAGRRAAPRAAIAGGVPAANAPATPSGGRDAAAAAVGALEAALREALGVAEPDDGAIVGRAVAAIDAARLGRALALMEAAGSAANRVAAAPFRAFLAADEAGRAAGWDAWASLLLTDSGKPRAVIRRSAFADAHPEVAEAFAAEAARVVAAEDRRRALSLARGTAALLALALPALAAHAAHKERAGLVDFADLIARTGLLLDDPGVAWVLFKLDGGLDHLLLDEVQDTSAAQWRLAGRLTEEFFAGEASAADARTGPRTVFAVGDFKQSIYSFQGADPDAFHTWRGVFRERSRAAGQRLAEPELATSFRSTAPVLRFVDRVFASADAARGVAEAGRPVPRHRSSRPDPGRVELWPLALGAAAGDDGAGEDASDAWTPALRNRAGIEGAARLAEALAARIAREVAAGALRPGDVLVLVRRRNSFARALVRALKARGVPVAGLDRIVLTDQTAVVDLLALCDAVLLPDDDLALATVLTSPLGFCDDPSLMALALGREGRTLWDTLRARAAERPAWEAARGLLERLRARADWSSPYAFLSEALGPEGGRARLHGRLGPEAGEAIDELLSAAIGFAAAHVPSLGGFVHWLRQAGAEVKRETPEGEEAVRLMTVHGSKGLEGRLVVLADTTSLPLASDPLLWTEAPGPVLPVWVPRADALSAGAAALRERARARALAEYNRLLYVALTRARDGLIVCGVAPGRGALDPLSWYAHCRRAMEEDHAARPLADAVFADAAGWLGEGFVSGDALPPPAPRAAATVAEPAVPERPEPASAPAADARGAARLRPSRPENAQWGPPPATLSPLARDGARGSRASARRRGEALHVLLQQVPAAADSGQEAAGRALAASLLPEADEAARDALVAEALAVIRHPALAAVFGPDARAEQRVAGLAGGRTVDGIVDRMRIGETAIDLVDFKSGRAAPAAPERTPVVYLRQMAAYRSVLRALRPGVPVRCALVWTAAPAVMTLPEALLDRHAPETWDDQAAGAGAPGSVA